MAVHFTPHVAIAPDVIPSERWSAEPYKVGRPLLPHGKQISDG